MAWLETGDIRTSFKIGSSGATDEQITLARSAALSQVRKVVSAAHFAEAAADEITTEGNERNRQSDIVNAHAFLTVAILTVTTSLRIRSDGSIKRQQDASSPATSQTITNEFLSPSETKTQKQLFEELANGLLSPYEVAELSDVVCGSEVRKSYSVAVVADW